MSKKYGAKKKYQDVDPNAGGGNIRRMKLQSGMNVIRIVEDGFDECWVHHFKDSEGKSRRAVCIGKKDCPICATGNKAKHRFFFNVIDRKQQKETGKVEVKLLEVGKMVYEGIRELALDDEYGDPTQYNIKITRKGEGKNDTKYSVRASTKVYPLKKSEMEVVESETEEGGAYDLDHFTTKQTKSELLEILGEGSDEEEDDEEEEGEEEEKPKKKKAKKKLAKEEDEEEEESDEDEDEDDDDEEEELDIDKELEELEDEDDDEEEEEKPKKKKKKKKAKDEDEEEEDDEDEDEDDDDDEF